ncbi:MAG: acyl-CoA dehydrogenase [Candidatus Dadabacteria bacterium]|nr:MAG: acyl-CoA dehydrogenase [Candidatus Dadabacteria bacterium]
MIDIRLDEEQQLIADTVRAFAQEQIRPAAREADETGRIPSELIEQAWQLAFVQASIPERYGGQGGPTSAVTGTVIAEAMAEGDLAIAVHALSARLVVDPILHIGSEEQKSTVLPRYAGDSFVAGSAAILEPQWNFAPSRMRTVARRRAGGYEIEGLKTMVPLANEAPYMVVYAADERDGRPCAFLLEAGTPGLVVGERDHHLGLKGLETFEVRFKGCRVPESARLPGDALVAIRRARVAQSAMAVGVAKASLSYAIDYAKEREAFGTKIAQKQAIAFMLAEMAIEVDAARLLNWEAAWHLDQGEEGAREVAIARRYSADMAMMVTDNGIQVLGGHGFIRDHPVEMWARNARGFATFECLASV